MNANIQFQYQCRLTGVVKAYKRMTLKEAEVFNFILEDKDANGRWVPQSASPKREGRVIYRPVNGSADGRYDAAA